MFSDTVDMKMQNAWATPLGRSINTLEKILYLLLLDNTMRTLLQEVLDIKGFVGQCPILQVQGGIGKLMYHVPQVGTTEVDFQFDADEASSRTRLLKWVNPICRLSTAGGVAPGTMTHRGQMWSIERYSNTYGSGWHAFTTGL